MKRILVTGSRGWTWDGILQQAVSSWITDNVVYKTQTVLVHGDAPNGADRIARDLARSAWWLVEEAHPADWEAPCDENCYPGHRQKKSGHEYCPAAGFRRNRQMVDLGADVCLAFILNGSNGATHTADAAEKAGIPVIRYEVTVKDDLIDLQIR